MPASSAKAARQLIGQPCQCLRLPIRPNLCGRDRPSRLTSGWPSRVLGRLVSSSPKQSVPTFACRRLPSIFEGSSGPAAPRRKGTNRPRMTGPRKRIGGGDPHLVCVALPKICSLACIWVAKSNCGIAQSFERRPTSGLSDAICRASKTTVCPILCREAGKGWLGKSGTTARNLIGR